MKAVPLSSPSRFIAPFQLHHKSETISLSAALHLSLLRSPSLLCCCDLSLSLQICADALSLSLQKCAAAPSLSLLLTLSSLLLISLVDLSLSLAATLPLLYISCSCSLSLATALPRVELRLSSSHPFSSLQICRKQSKKWVLGLEDNEPGSMLRKEDLDMNGCLIQMEYCVLTLRPSS